MEEEVSRNFILEEQPDIIINIVDSTSLERSLYLTTQLLELDCKVIIALNMVDLLEKKGINIDVKKLECELGTEIVEISAKKGIGIRELIGKLDEKIKKDKQYIYDAEIETAIEKIKMEMPTKTKNKRFIAVKLLENDEKFKDFNVKSVSKIISNLEKEYDTDLEEIIATERYKFIEEAKRQAITRHRTKESISDKLDKIFLNKWLGIPIFMIIMFLVYYLSVGVVGKYTVDLISELISKLNGKIEEILINLGTSEWAISLIVDGIIAGVGAVCQFIPQLIILFTCISILETTGYMSRIALILDRIFRKLGLSGKSLIPFVVGLGCSVPGIMGTKIIENQDERKITTVLTPFVPCSAKLPIIALFSGYFFEDYAGLVSTSLYFCAIVIIIFSALVMRKFIYRKTSNTYISELPEYKLPSLKYVTKDVYDRTISFIKRAGTVILVCSIGVWFLLSFSVDFKYGINIENSILAEIGKKISWIFYPILGANSWGATVSAIQGLIAKEQVISSMSVISGLTSNAETKMIFDNNVFEFFTPSSAYAFMVFNLFSAPCFGAIAAMKRELGTRKRVLKAVGFQITLAWCLATMVYQVGIRIENKSFNIVNLIILIIIGVAIILALKQQNNMRCRQCPYKNTCN